MLANQAMNYLATGSNPPRLGNGHPNIVPYQAFATADGYIMLTIGNDAQYRRFCELAERTDLADDERFEKNSGRVKHRNLLLPQLDEILRSKTSRQWLDDLNSRGIPCGPINNLDQVFADPQVQHRGLCMALEHPVAGQVPSISNPIRFSQTRIKHELAPPLLGQHTDAVLSRLLDLDREDLVRLRTDQVIA